MKTIFEFEHLVDALKSLPGVGLKNAKKWAFFLLNQDDRYIKKFIDSIQVAYQRIKRCCECKNISLNSLCNICTDQNRDKKKICVVSTLDDLERIEASHSYDGLYHLTDIDVNLKNHKLVKHNNIDSLKTRIENDKNINEIIIATSFSYDGEMVSEYICNLLKDFKYLQIYRIGFGLPSNSCIDYADDKTLQQSFCNKKKISF